MARDLLQGSRLHRDGVSADRSLHARRRPARWLWRQFHLWLGLALGLMFAFLGATGSVLVFHDEIDRFLNPDLLTRQSVAARDDAPIADVVTHVSARIGSVRRADLARALDDVHRLQVTRKGANADLLEVTVDPGSGRILGTRPWRAHLIAVIYDLHYTLLAGRIGRDLVGYAGLALLLSVATGLYAWWPRKGGLWKAVRIKRRAAGLRRLYDIHKTAGVSAALLLVVAAISGVSMQFPQATRSVVGQALEVVRVDEEDPAHAVARLPARPGLAGAIARAGEIVPDGRVARILMPSGDSGDYRIALRRPGEVLRSGGLNSIRIDAATGAVEAVKLAEDFSAADWFMAWQFPLHNGEAFRRAGRWVVFGLGWVPLALCITGCAMWWTKRAAQRRPHGVGRKTQRQ